uniref:Uncharacterized protein n=1 Tax=Anguilla anguilla TaxID=7936 RepID=A0A0E9SUM4_ANGAN
MSCLPFQIFSIFCAPPSHQNQLYVHIQGVWHPTPLLSCHWESDLG